MEFTIKQVEELLSKARAAIQTARIGTNSSNIVEAAHKIDQALGGFPDLAAPALLMAQEIMSAVAKGAKLDKHEYASAYSIVSNLLHGAAKATTSGSEIDQKAWDVFQQYLTMPQPTYPAREWPKPLVNVLADAGEKSAPGSLFEKNITADFRAVVAKLLPNERDEIYTSVLYINYRGGNNFIYRRSVNPNFRRAVWEDFKASVALSTTQERMQAYTGKFHTFSQAEDWSYLDDAIELASVDADTLPEAERLAAYKSMMEDLHTDSVESQRMRLRAKYASIAEASVDPSVRVEAINTMLKDEKNAALRLQLFEKLMRQISTLPARGARQDQYEDFLRVGGLSGKQHDEVLALLLGEATSQPVGETEGRLESFARIIELVDTADHETSDIALQATAGARATLAAIASPTARGAAIVKAMDGAFTKMAEGMLLEFLQEEPDANKRLAAASRYFKADDMLINKCLGPFIARTIAQLDDGCNGQRLGMSRTHARRCSQRRYATEGMLLAVNNIIDFAHHADADQREKICLEAFTYAASIADSHRYTYDERQQASTIKGRAETKLAGIIEETRDAAARYATYQEYIKDERFGIITFAAYTKSVGYMFLDKAKQVAIYDAHLAVPAEKERDVAFKEHILAARHAVASRTGDVAARVMAHLDYFEQVDPFVEEAKKYRQYHPGINRSILKQLEEDATLLPKDDHTLLAKTYQVLVLRKYQPSKKLVAKFYSHARRLPEQERLAQYRDAFEHGMVDAWTQFKLCADKITKPASLPAVYLDVCRGWTERDQDWIRTIRNESYERYMEVAGALPPLEAIAAYRLVLDRAVHSRHQNHWVEKALSGFWQQMESLPDDAAREAIYADVTATSKNDALLRTYANAWSLKQERLAQRPVALAMIANFMEALKVA